MSNDCLSILENEDERLLPGLSHDIVLNQIVPRLPWRACHILAFVSRSWRRAIRSRRVYDARVRSHSTETILVFNSKVDETSVLYSIRDDSWLRLPKLPTPSKQSFLRVTLDGKIYFLGLETRELNVLDVAGQGEWKPCANMPQGGFGIHCVVADGKIYVVGGVHSFAKPISDAKRTSACLVYDPKENAWSSTMPRKCKHHIVTEVVTVGEELFVHGRDPLSEVYHPGRDEWRLVKHFGVGEGDHMLVWFTAHGKLVMMTWCSHEMGGIYAHHIDSDGNYSWTLLHSYSCPDKFDANWKDSYLDCVFVPEDVGGELLALVVSVNTGQILYQSKGFGGDEDEIEWEAVPSEVLKDFQFPHSACSIQL